MFNFLCWSFFSRKKQTLNVKGNSTLDLKSFAVFCFIIFTILFFVNIYILNDVKITVFRKYDVFLFCIYLYGVFLVLLKIIYESKNDNYLKSLENLEYEIYTKQLGDDEIKNRLQTNYFGFLFQDWIEKKYEELKNFEDYIINSIEKIKNQEEKLELVNSVDEYNSMQASINDNKISFGNDVNNFYEDSVKQIQGVLDSKRIKKNNEVEKIENLINAYKLSKERYAINL